MSSKQPVVSTRPPDEPGFYDPDALREDYGFFGPDSVTWRIWTSPSTIIGFQRAITIETFDPFLSAAVDEQNGVRADIRHRMDRTGEYFEIVAVGDSKAAIEASELLLKVHSRAVGIEPVTGRRYNANNPDSQLWIHVTAWHSVLYCYEKYGPGRLSERDENQYWAECAIAAELQTCDPEKVPRSREAVREYFESMRKQLCMTEHSTEIAKLFLWPPLQRDTALIFPFTRLLSLATIASMPKWMRELGGFDQPNFFNLLIVPITRIVMWVTKPVALKMLLLKAFMPSIRPVWAKSLQGPPPLAPDIVTPAAARKRYGTSNPNLHSTAR